MSDSTPLLLSAEQFGDALQSGIHRVVIEQDYLNRINVFPVADGDTGTNLSLSLSASLQVLDDRGPGQRIDQLLVVVADALLDGARGNSGAIMAQFFQGLSDAAEGLAAFSGETYARAVALGSEYAHDAIAEPKPGTMLSVIAAYADSLGQLSERSGHALSQLLDEALDVARRALAETETQLDVLRKAGVVDAGARGFFVMLEGMHDFLAYGKATARPSLADQLADAAGYEMAANDADLEFRYCTECMISGHAIDRRRLREALSEHGNSLVIAGSKRKAKVHIHVDEPAVVFRVAARFGAVSAQKADNMQQQQASHGSGRRFAVITDSAADIPDDDIERLDIHMVPMRIQFGDRGYLDKVSISPAEFFAELRDNPEAPSTSQPAPGDFRRQFQFLASHYADVIAISLTATVSGTLQAAESAASRVEASGKVHVFNSMNASSGQGQLAVFAAECAQQGLDVDDTLAKLRELLPLTKSFALIEELSFAVKGGRVPRYVKLIADFLRVTPILVTTPEGRIAPGGVVRGRKDPLPGFARFIAKRVDRSVPLRVTIGHAVCPDKARRLDAMLHEQLPHIGKSNICELGSALGAHGGPGTLVVGLQHERPPSRGRGISLANNA